MQIIIFLTEDLVYQAITTRPLTLALISSLQPSILTSIAIIALRYHSALEQSELLSLASVLPCFLFLRLPLTLSFFLRCHLYALLS